MSILYLYNTQFDSQKWPINKMDYILFSFNN